MESYSFTYVKAGSKTKIAGFTSDNLDLLKRIGDEEVRNGNYDLIEIWDETDNFPVARYNKAQYFCAYDGETEVIYEP